VPAEGINVYISEDNIAEVFADIQGPGAFELRLAALLSTKFTGRWYPVPQRNFQDEADAPHRLSSLSTER